MEIDNKLKVDMYAVLLIQCMWLIYVIMIKFESVGSIGIIILIGGFLYTLLMHIILTSNVSSEKIILMKRVKYYFMSLLIFNTLVLLAISTKTSMVALTIIAMLFTSYLTKKKISDAMKIKRYDNKSPVRYFVVIIAGLLGSYYPILGLNLMYIVVSLACTYVYNKQAILQLEIKNTRE